MPALRRLIPVLTVTLALVLVGCSGDDGPDDPEIAATDAAAPEPSNDDAVGTLIDLGLQQVAEGELERARGTFESVLALEPDNVYAHYNLGFIAQSEGEGLRAVEWYAGALERDADFAPALYNLAILTETDDLEAATEFYRRVIALQPEDAAAHMRLGFALRELGREAEAQEMLDRGIELDPAMADVAAPSYGD